MCSRRECTGTRSRAFFCRETKMKSCSESHYRWLYNLPGPGGRICEWVGRDIRSHSGHGPLKVLSNSLKLACVLQSIVPIHLRNKGCLKSPLEGLDIAESWSVWVTRRVTFVLQSGETDRDTRQQYSFTSWLGFHVDLSLDCNI